MAKKQTQLKVVKDNSNRIVLDVKSKSLEVVQAIGDHVLDLATANLEKFNKIDTGMLMNSGQVVTDDENVKVIFDAPYASTVEFGREPGTMPPVEQIQRWAERRGLTDRRAKGERGSPTDVGYAIAQKIKRDGIKPTPFLRDAVTKAKADVPRIVKQFKEV